MRRGDCTYLPRDWDVEGFTENKWQADSSPLSPSAVPPLSLEPEPGNKGAGAKSVRLTINSHLRADVFRDVRASCCFTAQEKGFVHFIDIILRQQVLSMGKKLLFKGFTS